MTDAAPVFLVRFRPGRGRWKRIGTAATRAEALALVNCAGDFHIIEGTNDRADDERDDLDGRDERGTGADPG